MLCNKKYYVISQLKLKTKAILCITFTIASKAEEKVDLISIEWLDLEKLLSVENKSIYFKLFVMVQPLYLGPPTQNILNSKFLKVF